MNVTLDGFLAGPHYELDWHFESWNGEMAESLAGQLGEADTILLGRVTYKAMAAWWQNKIRDINTPRCDIALASMMDNYTKIVFSRTLTAVTEWNNSRLAKGDMENEIHELKKQPGRNLIIYGSAGIVSALLPLQVIDEFRVWIHPVVIGNGKALFKTVQQTLYLQLQKTVVFKSGVVLLYYTCKS